MQCVGQLDYIMRKVRRRNAEEEPKLELCVFLYSSETQTNKQNKVVSVIQPFHRSLSSSSLSLCRSLLILVYVVGGGGGGAAAAVTDIADGKAIICCIYYFVHILLQKSHPPACRVASSQGA